MKNITNVKLLTSGTESGVAAMNLGVANNLISSVREILKNYII